MIFPHGDFKVPSAEAALRPVFVYVSFQLLLLHYGIQFIQFSDAGDTCHAGLTDGKTCFWPRVSAFSV